MVGHMVYMYHNEQRLRVLFAPIFSEYIAMRGFVQDREFLVVEGSLAVFFMN